MVNELKQIIKKILLRKRFNTCFFSKDSIINGKCIFSNYNSLFGSVVTDVCLGQYSYIGKSSITNAEIGSFCAIASDVKIGSGMHPTNYLSINPIFYSKSTQLKRKFSDKDFFSEYKRTFVGNDVWIGTSVWIKDGITIGDGAIIAAGAIVTKDVEPYAIVGGNPARLIKKRFKQEYINKLLQAKWWTWNEDKLVSNLNFFQSDLSKNEKLFDEILEVAENDKENNK